MLADVPKTTVAEPLDDPVGPEPLGTKERGVLVGMIEVPDVVVVGELVVGTATASRIIRRTASSDRTTGTGRGELALGDGWLLLLELNTVLPPDEVVIGLDVVRVGTLLVDIFQ